MTLRGGLQPGTTGRRPADQGCMLSPDRFPSILDVVLLVRMTRLTLDGPFRWLVPQSCEGLRGTGATNQREEEKRDVGRQILWRCESVGLRVPCAAVWG